MTLAIKSLDLFELICDYPYILLRLQRDNYRHEFRGYSIFAHQTVSLANNLTDSALYGL